MAFDIGPNYSSKDASRRPLYNTGHAGDSDSVMV